MWKTEEGARARDSEGWRKGEIKQTAGRRLWRGRRGTGDGWMEERTDKREDVGVYVRGDTKGRSETGDGGECHRGETAEGKAWENDIEDGVRGSRSRGEKERDVPEGLETEHTKTIKK